MVFVGVDNFKVLVFKVILGFVLFMVVVGVLKGFLLGSEVLYSIIWFGELLNYIFCVLL